ncbi:MAG: nicotinate phosphoribosyltransferase [Treponema sp.]|jgi:nicotinate phosphoribosyltransferase|nr:nicotinate phosphoribosyltransferase [Treponema sp.]
MAVPAKNAEACPGGADHAAGSPADSALFNDFYSLTMAQGYWKKNMNQSAVFEMFFRKNPFGGGYAIFAGLGTLLDRLRSFSFSETDIAYLKGLGFFEEAFIEYLRNFRFTGALWAMDEGTVVFPQEPLIRVRGGLIECQIIEGMLLNTINFQSLIATKTCRVWLASGKGSIMEFGLRRAQGPDGAMSAARASYIGGASGTSNTLAGKVFDIPVLGTMAHSWVMAFPSEEEAFDAYAEIYPNKTIFLIDTYDTLKSGVLNAIKAGGRLYAKGKNFGVRLDSGDIHYLSVEVRRLLDEAGLSKATITVSNDLDESIIQTLVNAGAPVDTWGVGTQMVTGGTEAAFTGVYKLAAREGPGGLQTPVMKFSDNPEKTTNPGVKQVWRIKDGAGMAVADVLSLDQTGPIRGGADDGAASEVLEKGRGYAFWHTSADYRHFHHLIEGGVEPLLKQRLKDGELCAAAPSLPEIRARRAADLECFDSSYKRHLNPHVYKVSITEKLRELKLELIKNYLGDL